MVFHPSSWISGLLGASNLLLVMTLAARLWSFCNWPSSTEPQQPQTEQQYQKRGSTIPVYRVFKVSFGRKELACFKKPTALETLVETALICSVKRAVNLWHLVLWTSSSLLSRIFKTTLSFWLWRIVRFWLVQRSMECVFATFKVSLLPCSQVSNILRSLLVASLS